MVGAKPTALKAMLARGVTAVALTEWLEGSPKAALRALADVVVVVSAAAPAPPTPLPLPRCCPASGASGKLMNISIRFYEIS